MMGAIRIRRTEYVKRRIGDLSYLKREENIVNSNDEVYNMAVAA